MFEVLWAQAPMTSSSIANLAEALLATIFHLSGIKAGTAAAEGKPSEGGSRGISSRTLRGSLQASRY
jgi:hypothetical protein